MLRTRVLALLFSGAALLGAAPGRGAGKPSARHSSATGAAVAESSAHAVPRRPAIYMAWHAPWGTPGARDTARWACDDTLAADTLYLTFDPGEDIPSLIGIDGTLVFHAGPGDTLGPFWDLSRKGANPFNLRIEYDPPPAGAPGAWPLPGAGSVRYGVRGDRGQLDLTYFVPASRGGPLYAGTRYFAARVMIRMRRAFLAGCLQPVCADFDHLLISHTNGSRWINTGERFTSWNSAGGAACRECRGRPPSEEPPRIGWDRDANPVRGPSPTVRDTTSR